MQPERTGLLVVGGSSTTGDIIVRPPWESEQAEAILVAVTAIGNTAANIIYGAADGAQVGQGAGVILSPDRGFVFAITGAGSIPLAYVPIRVTEFLRITPLPAANGHIFVMYFWQRLMVPTQVDMAPIDLPQMRDVEASPDRAKRQMEDIWTRAQGVRPPKLERQEKEALTRRQQEQMRQLESLMQPPR